VASPRFLLMSKIEARKDENGGQMGDPIEKMGEIAEGFHRDPPLLGGRGLEARKDRVGCHWEASLSGAIELCLSWAEILSSFRQTLGCAWGGQTSRRAGAVITPSEKRQYDATCLG
jgi:hypothetical protein